MSEELFRATSDERRATVVCRSFQKFVSAACASTPFERKNIVVRLRSNDFLTNVFNVIGYRGTPIVQMSGL